jgi:hypothetical protein
MMPEFYIVGIDDPYDLEPLEPTVKNSSGEKLWRMSGLSIEEYRSLFKRRNLFSQTGGPRSARELRAAATKLSADFDPEKITNVLALGNLVSVAFGWYGTHPLNWSDSIFKNVRVVLIPHTSGLNRWYNLEDNRIAATDFVAGVADVAKKYASNVNLWES